MKDIKSEDIHKVVKGLISMCEMREFLKKHEEEDMKDIKSEDIHKVVKGLISICEMREFLKKHEEEDYERY